jgi:hypothetical protein
MSTVPVCPARDGVARTDVAVVKPLYVSVMAVNANVCCGTCTITVPVSPGRLGVANVRVAVMGPA